MSRCTQTNGSCSWNSESWLGSWHLKVSDQAAGVQLAFLAKLWGMAVSKIRHFTSLPIASAHLSFFHSKPRQLHRSCNLRVGDFSAGGQQSILRDPRVQSLTSGAYRTPQLDLLHPRASHNSESISCNRLVSSCAVSSETKTCLRSAFAWEAGSKLRVPVPSPAFSCIWLRRSRYGTLQRSSMAQALSAEQGQEVTGQSSTPGRYAIFITGELLVDCL